MDETHLTENISNFFGKITQLVEDPDKLQVISEKIQTEFDKVNVDWYNSLPAKIQIKMGLLLREHKSLFNVVDKIETHPAEIDKESMVRILIWLNGIDFLNIHQLPKLTISEVCFDIMRTLNDKFQNENNNSGNFQNIFKLIQSSLKIMADVCVYDEFDKLSVVPELKINNTADINSILDEMYKVLACENVGELNPIHSYTFSLLFIINLYILIVSKPVLTNNEMINYMLTNHEQYFIGTICTLLINFLINQYSEKYWVEYRNDNSTIKEVFNELSKIKFFKTRISKKQLSILDLDTKTKYDQFAQEISSNPFLQKFSLIPWIYEITGNKKSRAKIMIQSFYETILQQKSCYSNGAIGGGGSSGSSGDDSSNNNNNNNNDKKRKYTEKDKKNLNDLYDSLTQYFQNYNNKLYDEQLLYLILNQRGVTDLLENLIPT